VVALTLPGYIRQQKAAFATLHSPCEQGRIEDGCRATNSGFFGSLLDDSAERCFAITAAGSVAGVLGNELNRAFSSLQACMRDGPRERASERTEGGQLIDRQSA